MYGNPPFGGLGTGAVVAATSYRLDVPAAVGLTAVFAALAALAWYRAFRLKGREFR